MLLNRKTIDITNNGIERTICVTPLFFKSQHESWGTNEIYELSETADKQDKPEFEFIEPTVLGHIVVDEKKEWRLDGESDLTDENIEKLANFVLNYEEK
jgi:hypothetical protein